MFFFNNCRDRDYPSIYGIDDAFYDLQETGDQAKKATTFRPGDEGIVATGIGSGRVRFASVRLARVEKRPDEKGKIERVFCGPTLQSETLSKGDAARDAQYSVFFDKNGNFKRQSVLER
jgi:hypothetical protein